MDSTNELDDKMTTIVDTPELVTVVTTPEPSTFREVFAVGEKEVVFIVAAIQDEIDASVFAARIIDRKTWQVIAEENGLTIPETCARFKKVFEALKRELVGADADSQENVVPCPACNGNGWHLCDLCNGDSRVTSGQADDWRKRVEAES